MRTLKITICEGYNLYQFSTEGYLGTLVILSGGLTTEKTSVKKKESGYCMWNETLDVLQKGTKRVNISITVWDIYDNREVCTGYCIFPSKPSMDSSILTLDLSSRPGRNDYAQGKVTCRIVPGDNKIKLKPEKADEKQVKSRISAANSKHSTELDLTGCNLKDIPAIALEKPRWTYLDISFNYINDWPNSLTTLRESLRELLISSNGITEIGASIGKLTNLNSIYLNGNCIRALPPEIESLTSLVVLSLDNNGLQSIPPQIGSLKSLEILKLSYNPICKLPVEIGMCTSLIHIDMTGSSLESLPEEFYQLRKLTNVNFSFNKLTQLSESISNLVNLNVVDLSHNKLTDLPCGIGICPIDTLLLDANPLTNDELVAVAADPYKIRIYLRKRYKEQIDAQKASLKETESDSQNTVGKPTVELTAINSSDYLTNDEIVADFPKWATVFMEYLDGAKDAVLNEESTKNTTENQSWKQLCHYGQRLCSVIKKRLAQIKKDVMLAKSLEDLTQMSPPLERIGHIINDFFFYFPSQSRLHSVQLFLHETTLQKQKKLHIYVLKELDVVVMSMLSAVTQKSPIQDLNTMLEFVKGILTELVIIPVKDTSKDD
ncbi:leucine-rich repeat-containing protein 40-like [Schistocerca gregaria]|uniref:leucine-rich repeat-containing protein 40-like n=1 Tax=Schistocerca gregaria TaxID=7010 RepID=UPI00211EF081|nr:leucine-rich repeat-containing protein 40-like [Schistocerca gregaria]